jgi:CRISPR-associated protein Cas2
VYFLIAYDVADPRRLARVARRLERQAFRVQYSVFLFEGPRAALRLLLDDVGDVIRPSEDRLQAWALDCRESPLGELRGRPMTIFPASAVLAADAVRLVARWRSKNKPI